MDDKDRLLISLLKRNARLPIVALARDLDLSRSATQERLAKLVANKSISGFTIIEQKLDATEHAAHLLVELEKGKTCALVVPHLKKIPFITAIHSVAGEFDLVIRLQVGSIAELESSRAKIAAIKGISAMKTLISLERHFG
jgi:Lrp/AsnC family transcriptional regulator, leucine-responsive regulatory protein